MALIGDVPKTSNIAIAFNLPDIWCAENFWEKLEYVKGDDMYKDAYVEHANLTQEEWRDVLPLSVQHAYSYYLDLIRQNKYDNSFLEYYHNLDKSYAPGPYFVNPDHAPLSDKSELEQQMETIITYLTNNPEKCPFLIK